MKGFKILAIATLICSMSFVSSASGSPLLEKSNMVRQTEAKLSVSGAAVSERLNVNQATLEQLVAIKGIGPSKAAAIIKYRNDIGGFADIEELIEVKGIGQKALAKLKLVLEV
ncbi:helix-hairpin-helix domain-containing protein [Psychrosphaera sp.]|nr:helix-hairpin-helix domain-containing protein [Psychrosphaera sp.]